MNLVQRLTPLFIILALVGLGGGGYFFYQYYLAQQEIQLMKSDPAAAQAAQTKKTVEAVGKLIELPPGEDPTVATVTDINKLNDQPFFQKAKNGDKVLIYTQAKKAIIFDPLAGKIVDVATINIGSPSAQPQQVKVALRNGTTTVGLTVRIEKVLLKANSSLEVVSKENAAKNTYDKTVVVVINDSVKGVAEAVAQTLNASVGSLPEGETIDKNVDVLIILGKDATQ